MPRTTRRAHRSKFNAPQPIRANRRFRIVRVVRTRSLRTRFHVYFFFFLSFFLFFCFETHCVIGRSRIFVSSPRPPTPRIPHVGGWYVERIAGNVQAGSQSTDQRTVRGTLIKIPLGRYFARYGKHWKTIAPRISPGGY